MIQLSTDVDQAIACSYPALDLAMNHHRSTHNKPLDLASQYFFQVPILKDDSQYIVVMKSVQVTISETLIIKMFDKLRRGWAVIYSLPIESLRNTFVANRIDTAIDNVPLYRAGMDQATGRSDQVGMKHLWGGVIKFVGSNSKLSFLEFPADILIIDEKDRSDIDNLKMAPDRLDASEHKYIWEVGNPTHSKFGIHKSYLESDKKQWHIKCDACNEWQPLDFFKNVVRRIDETRYELIDKWIPDEDRDINVYCRHCLAPINRLMPGEYVAEYPERSISGYHISQLFSPTKTIRELWEMFIEAQTNPTIMQVFHNSRLGLPYEGVGDYLTAALLESKCMKDYLMPSTSDSSIMGMDVGGKLHIRISEILEDNKRRAVYIGSVNSFDEAATLIMRYNVNTCVVDAKPEIHKVREFQEKFPHIVWLCDYTSEKVDFWNVNDTEKIIKVDRTASIDGMISEILKGDDYLPKDFRTLDRGDYISHMEAPKRKLDSKSKSLRYVWDEEGKPDHYFHASNYDYLAYRILRDAPQPWITFA